MKIGYNNDLESFVYQLKTIRTKRSISLPRPFLSAPIDGFDHPVSLDSFIKVHISPFLPRSKGVVNQADASECRRRASDIHLGPLFPFDGLIHVLPLLRLLRRGRFVQMEFRGAEGQKGARAGEFQGALFAGDDPFEAVRGGFGGVHVCETDRGAALENALDGDGICQLARLRGRFGPVVFGELDGGVGGGCGSIQGSELAQEEAKGI